MAKHRKRHNPAIAAGSPVKALTSAFNKEVLVKAGFIVAGSVATTAVANLVTSKVSMLKDNKLANIATTLLTAGLVAYGAKRVLPARANDVLIGGILSGAAKAIDAYVPSLKMSGCEGIGCMGFDQPSDMGDFVSARQPMIAMNDYVALQTPISQMNGVADVAVAEEIDMQA